MTECNGCGSCCDPVIMPYSKKFALAHPEQFPADSLTWIRDDLTEVPRSFAKNREPEFVRRLTKRGRRAGQVLHFFICRHFDSVNRSCRNYADRPLVCRIYPWAEGARPRVGMPLPPTCSFNADIGQPVKFLGLQRPLPQ